MSPKIIPLFLFLIISSNCQDVDAIIKKLKSYLQNNVDNDVFLDFMDFLQKRFRKKFPDHLEKNRKAFPNHLKTIKLNKGFIEDQGNYKDMVYGLSPFQANGCELIAIYNALYEMTKKEDIDLPLIIDIHEKNGMVLNGLFGTAPRAIETYFKNNGYKTMSASKKDKYESIAKSSDVLILTIYNNIEDITDQVHTICITKKQGKYYVHNNGSKSSTVPYNSITDVLARINGGKAKDIFLIGINKK